MVVWQEPERYEIRLPRCPKQKGERSCYKEEPRSDSFIIGDSLVLSRDQVERLKVLMHSLNNLARGL